MKVRSVAAALAGLCGVVIHASGCAAHAPSSRAGLIAPQAAEQPPAAACAAELATVEARLARLDRARTRIIGALSSAGFPRTVAESANDSAGARELRLDAARSADALEARFAGRTLAFEGVRQQVDWIALNWFDSVRRQWSARQVRALASLTEAEFGNLKTQTTALLEMLPDIAVSTRRRLELLTCAAMPLQARDERASPVQPFAPPDPPATTPVVCDARSSQVTCRESVVIEAPELMSWLRPLNAVSLGADELTVIGPDTTAWAAFARGASGPAVGVERVYVDGMPAATPPAASIGRISVNTDPFSAEYAGVGEVRIDVDLMPPERRWRVNGSAPSFGAGGGSPLGPSGAPVSRASELSVSGPVPRLPLTFSVHGATRLSRRRPTFVEPESSTLAPATDELLSSSRGSSLIAGVAFASARVLARATFSGGAAHASHVGIGGTNGPTTGQRLDTVQRALQASWRVADSGRIHRGALSVGHERLDADAESFEPAVRVVGQLATGGAALAAAARRATSWAARHVLDGAEGRWKVGIEANHDTIAERRVPNAGGRLHVSSLGAATGTWIVGLHQSAAETGTTSAAMFAERLALDTRRFSARGGLRADWQNGAGLRVSPRVVAAARAGRLQLSGGAGLFVQRWLPDLLLAAAHDGSSDTYVVQDVLVGAPPRVDPSSGVQLRTVMPGTFERRQDMIVRGGILWRAGPVQAGIEHTWTRGESLPGVMRERDALGLLDTIASDRKLRLHQTHARASLRFTAALVVAHYQHARALDDGDDALTAPVERGGVEGEWGRKSGVPRHAASLSAVLRLPLKVRMSLSAQGHAGMPFTVITGRDSAGLATFADRGGRPRNDGVLPPSFKLSLFVARTVRIPAFEWLAFDAGVRADNLTDHRNITSVGSVIGTPMFGRPLAAAPGRSIRFWVALAR